MTPEESVTRWIGGLKTGDETAARELWNRYFARLVGLARARLAGRPARGADEEDVALSAFDSFCRGAAEGRFPRLEDRDDLWRLLVVITARKTADLRRRENAAKRGGGMSAAGPDPADGSDTDVLDRIAGREPDPEFAAAVGEQFRLLFDGLGDETLRRVAVLKMEGYANNEIADRLGCVPRTVERKLRLIRSKWEGAA